MTSKGDSGERPRRLGTLWAQGMVALIAHRLAPALAAGLIAASHLGSAGGGIVVAVAVFFASRLLDRSRLPLNLMPLARVLVRTAVPVVGAALALVTLWLAGAPESVGHFVAPVAGAWLVMLFGEFWAARFAAARPVRVAVIGSSGLAIGLSEELHGARVRSHEVVGWVAGDDPTCDRAEGGPRRLGSLSNLRQVVLRHSVDLIVYGSALPGEDDAPQRSRLDIFERVAATCLDLPVRMVEASQLYEDLLGHVPLGQSNSAWFQYLLHPRYRPGVPGAKRSFDLVVSAVTLILTAPILAACAIAIKLTDGGPVLYRQRRIGEGGAEFEMIKLRSMYVAAESRGPRWSAADDERVTPIGRIMRSLHVDELPQLINVLRGEMTLVGPRPERRELITELELQLPFYDRRHIVKPGIAGWAQARCGYGGSEEGTGWKLCHDLYYLKHRSVYFDLLVLIENVRVTLRGGMQFDLRSPQEQFILGRAGGGSAAGG